MSEAEEEWRDVPEYEGLYQVSNLGKIKSLNREIVSSLGYTLKYKGRILKQSYNQDGYSMVSLCNSGVQKTIKVHLIVGQAFIPNPENKPQINHKDGIKDNNCVKNLERVTSKENVSHAWENGLSKPITGKNHYKCKLTEKQVMEIRENKNGLNFCELGRRYKISGAHAQKIHQKQSWKHIK